MLLVPSASYFLPWRSFRHCPSWSEWEAAIILPFHRCGKRQLAEQVASVAFFTGLIIGLLIAVLGNLSLRNIVFFLGATETIAPFAQDYARYIFLAAPFMVTSFIMNNLLRFQGKALFAMVGITTGGILNIILDPIFIFSLGLGTSGAALATALSR